MEEISAENLAELEKRYKLTLFIVFMAQIFPAVVFVCLAWFLTRNREAIAPEKSFLTLWMVILFIAAGTFVLRRQMFSWERLKNVTLLKGVSGLIERLQSNTVILNVFAFIVVMIGFGIALQNTDFFDMLRASGVALIIYALNFPRLSIWKKIVSNLEKV